MADKELLELAAKAAGIQLSELGGGARYAPQPGIMQPYVPWNPLTDDGDALRLAVQLRIEVDYYLADVQAKHDGCDPVFEIFSEHTDPYAATRRAIVRAAAEIGRSMS